MTENWLRHVYDTLCRISEAPVNVKCRIETYVKTNEKTLGPATDQGNDARLLTTEEVAFWLQIAPKTLRNWRSTGTGPPALKLYNAVRYDRATVQAWASETSKAAG
ncbi:helix-turn-helix domain-containing protein [Arthrobacter sp. H5]|uniref:helix-turn-helix transcriptional regulator n=1 Tax=Arthrobacter sp. H5 TaxID=1267973 RepID=UPI0023B82759|nr:helix-turn-helix domain-containing protein [Arthrobacter sp. H5]